MLIDMAKNTDGDSRLGEIMIQLSETIDGNAGGER